MIHPLSLWELAVLPPRHQRQNDVNDHLSTVQLLNCNILIYSSCAMKMTNFDDKLIDEEVNETI